MLAVSMPNLLTSASAVETATKCLATAASLFNAPTIHFRAVAALVMVSSVVKVFEERMNRVSEGSRSCVASANAAPSTLATKRNVIARSLNPRSAADADVNYVLDPLAGVTFPFAAADAIGKSRHLVEHGMDFRHHVAAVDLDLNALRGAQCDVEHGAFLGDVYLLTPEHRVAPLGNTALLRKLEKQALRFGGDAVLGVVEVQPRAFGGEGLAAFGIFGEHLPEFHVLDFVVMRLERAPRGGFSG